MGLEKSKLLLRGWIAKIRYLSMSIVVFKLLKVQWKREEWSMPSKSIPLLLETHRKKGVDFCISFCYNFTE